MSSSGKDTGHLPASEADDPALRDDAGNADTSLPASEADLLSDEEHKGEPQSWPGRDFGSIPPPG